MDIPLSWPGAHAHSFVEKIYRSDLDALTKLVKAIIEEWELAGPGQFRNRTLTKTISDRIHQLSVSIRTASKQAPGSSPN